MRVKVCGVTRVLDAQRAAEFGVDAIGLNFWAGSKRVVSVPLARKIVRALPPLVWAVGVFVNATRHEIEQVILKVGLHAIQLHGDELPAETRGYRVPVFKAVHLGHQLPRVRFAAPLVLDAQQPGYGGGGVTLNWALARRIAADRTVLLAGGLTPKNVARAIAAVRPFGVDVASGVESAVGIKDARLMKQFVQAATRAR